MCEGSRKACAYLNELSARVMQHIVRGAQKLERTHGLVCWRVLICKGEEKACAYLNELCARVTQNIVSGAQKLERTKLWLRQEQVTAHKLHHLL